MHSEVPGPLAGLEGDPPMLAAIRAALGAGDVEGVLRCLQSGERVHVKPTAGGKAHSLKAVVTAKRDAAWRGCTRAEVEVVWEPYAYRCPVPIPPAVPERGATLTVFRSRRPAVCFGLKPGLACGLAWELDRLPREDDPQAVRNAARLRWDTPLPTIVEVRDEVQRALDDFARRGWVPPLMSPDASHRLTDALRWARTAAAAAAVYELFE